MNDLLKDLKNEFQDSDFRYAYAQSFLNTKLAVQIKTLREQRQKSQAQIAALMGIKQPGYQRFEDIDHSVWKTDSLWSIARALGVRLNIGFETFGTLPEEKRNFNKRSLERPAFEDDPAFNEPKEKSKIREIGAIGSINAPHVPDELTRYADGSIATASAGISRFPIQQKSPANAQTETLGSLAGSPDRGKVLGFPQKTEEKTI